MLVTNNIAMYAKACGFDENTERCIVLNVDGTHGHAFYNPHAHFSYMLEVIAKVPTMDQLYHWLRDTKQMYVQIVLDKTTRPAFSYCIDEFVGDPKDLTKEWKWIEHKFNEGLYHDYKEAYMEALRDACLLTYSNIIDQRSHDERRNILEQTP